MDEPKEKKRKITFSEDRCCFCNKNFSEKKTILDPKKCDSLLSACRSKTDDFSQNITACESQIRNGDIKIAYHKTCRSKFNHPFYNTPHSNKQQKQTPSKKNTRSSFDSEFDWKEKCFICGETCSVKHRYKWSKVEGSIDETSVLYSKLLEASTAKCDSTLRARLLSSNGDLVAVEARYHRKAGCLAKYLSSYTKVSKTTNELQIACECLKNDIFESVEIQKNIFELSHLQSKLKEIAESRNLTIDINQVNVTQIKRILNKVWPELKFIPRKGLSNLVCSKSLQADEALCKFVALQKNVNALEEQIDLDQRLAEQFECSEERELTVVHEAALILRKRLLKTSGLRNEYYSSSEINTEFTKNFLDGHLLKFVQWLSADSDASNMADDVVPSQRVLSTSCDLTYLVKPVTTPKHLGLSVYLHHCYGSKKLIEDLHEHGYTISYSEVRHFLTSAAVHMASIQNQTPSGGLVPSQLSKGDLIIAAADNWDHNENTLSGKRSTNAMTSILVQCPDSETKEASRIPRVPDRSIDISALPGRGLTHTLTYQKPEKRPSPVLDPPVKPGELAPPEPEDAKLLRLKELLYTAGRNSLLGCCDDRAVTKEAFPTWTVFQSVVTDDVVTEPANIVFNPIIMAPPNDLNTVYTVLKRTKEQMAALGQNVCPIVFDMGLLSKALEIVWARPTEFEGVYPLEGGMHFMMSVFGGIGYVYGDAGLKQLLTESDVFARLTAEHILSGKDFDRALKGLIMVDEVLNQRFFHHFLQWADDKSQVPAKLLERLKEIEGDFVKHKADVQGLLKDLESDIAPLIEQFRSEGKTSSPLFRFWDEYLTEVSWPMKLYLTSSRHGLWQAHKYAKAKLLPFLFSSNRTVYSRFMPYLLLQNNRLPQQIAEKFEEGKFVAKLTQGSFNTVWFDYILEVTENKALKSSGGIIGLTHNDCALTRWFLARPLTAKYATSYTSVKDNSTGHHTDTPFHAHAYNTAVNKMIGLFEDDTFIDPFALASPPTRLVNISSGVEMPPDVEKSLLACHEKGKRSLDTFVSERFRVEDSEQHSKPFFDPLTRSKILTQAPKSKSRMKSGTLPLDGEEIYLRLLAINAMKKVPLQRVLSFENAHVPMSLFTDDGSFMSTKKSDFLEKLESLLDTDSYGLDSSSPCDCIVFDAMAVIQMLQPQAGEKTTYSTMAQSFWQYILSHTQGSIQVHVVFDRYTEDSLKTQTRQKRGENISTSGPVALQFNMVIGDWKKVLSSTKSKSELTRLYTRYLAANCHNMLDDNTVVYVSGGLEEVALKITSSYVRYEKELDSNHEEADSRLMLHVAHAASLGSQQAIVFSPDTDVLVLLIHLFPQLGLESVYFKTGRRGRHIDHTRYIPVHALVNSLTPQQRQVILPVYCLTGCDTCSSFYGIGKKKAFHVLKQSAHELVPLGNLGKAPILDPETKQAAFQFVGLLYGHQNCTSLNSVRKMHVLGKKRVRPRRMPPTDDSLILHIQFCVQRCIHQLLIWRSSLTPMLPMLDPLDFGYIRDTKTGLYTPQLMTQAVAPPELLSDLVCSCIDMCTNNCVCSNNEQPCTQACACKGVVEGPVCENLFTILANVETSVDIGEFE